jgi:hypothetical protein
VKIENGDLVADSHNILNRWKNYLNVHSVNFVRHIEVYAAEPLISNPTAFQTKIAFLKLKKDK